MSDCSFALIVGRKPAQWRVTVTCQRTVMICSVWNKLEAEELARKWHPTPNLGMKVGLRVFRQFGKLSSLRWSPEPVSKRLPSAESAD